MRHPKIRNTGLWILQVLLAALFLFAGSVKFTMSPEALAAQTGLPALFMELIGVAEVAGGLGLLLPGLVRVRRDLTPVAAVGLVGVMVGAVVLTAPISLGGAVVPFVVGLLLLAVVRGRRGWAAATS